MKAPEFIETERLNLRRPLLSDAETIFARYASDPDVTRYLRWPRHKSIEQTRGFLSLSDDAWEKSPGGPYIIESRESGTVLGSAGFGFETPFRAAVGYVFAKDAWGRGYSTEALRALTAVSPEIGVRYLYACCHPDHKVSGRVLEKCGFVLEGTLQHHSEFPNLEGIGPKDVLCYSRAFG
jgi:[ribosomal protein S5]-alanine N-acetyltransferase